MPHPIPPHMEPHPEHPWDINPFAHDLHRVAPECDDQLAVFSTVGRGLRGDSAIVRIKSDTDAETYLEGLVYDAATNEYSTEWVSENINGGQLMYQYNLRPFANPQTFTITFNYRRPNRSESEWSWTTPAIPYMWDADGDGTADIDDIVGAGVATLFLKKTTEPTWNYPTVTVSDYAGGLMTPEKHDKLIYPDNWTREALNAPEPGDAWSVNLQYGIGGDIDAPNVDDLAKVLGITVQQLRNIIGDQTGQIVGDGIEGDNVKDYIDDLNSHIHDDMGFDDHLIRDDDDVVRNTIKKYIDGARFDLYKNLGVVDPSDTDAEKYDEVADISLPYTQKHGADAGTTVNYPTLKQYIDARCDDLEEGLLGSLQEIVNHVVGGGTVNPDGSITWNTAGNIAVGNINLYSGDDSGDHIIRTHTGSYADDDLLAV